MRPRYWFVLGLLGALGWIVWSDVTGARWHPLAPRRVRRMLDLAEVGPGDVVYDLGAGDGRIVIEAARRGAIGVGVEIDPARAAWARSAAARAGVADRVTIERGDLFETDIASADVVTCFLRQRTNDVLEEKLLREAAPGTRVVSSYYTFSRLQPLAVDEALETYAYAVPKDSGATAQR